MNRSQVKNIPNRGAASAQVLGCTFSRHVLGAARRGVTDGGNNRRRGQSSSSSDPVRSALRERWETWKNFG